MHPYSVIIKPVVSEKSNNLREETAEKDAGIKYSFLVRKDAGKKDIRRAIKKLWDVEAVKINTQIRRDKVKRRGKFLSKPGVTKRAIVTLEKGKKLPLFEDQ